VRDVFEDSGLISDLETAEDALKVGSVEQPDAPDIIDGATQGKPVRAWTYEYDVRCTMLDSIVSPEE
jgi:hypothetical protein